MTIIWKRMEKLHFEKFEPNTADVNCKVRISK